MNATEFAEVKLYKKAIIIALIIDLAIVCIILFTYFISKSKSYLYFILLILFTIPGILYYLYRYCTVKNDIKNYEIYTTTFKEPITSFIHGRFLSFKFNITVDGILITRKTRAFFSTSSINGLEIVEYVQKEVLIAYNKNTDDVVVVGPKY